MKYVIAITCILVLWPVVVTAQDIPQPYSYSTTSAPSDSTWFNFDITDSLLIDSTISHEVRYRDAGETIWNSAEITSLYNACSTFTYAGFIDYQPISGSLEWYFRSEHDTAVVSGSPKNTSDNFPVPAHLEADLGTDSVGDVENGGSNLDIVHMYGSYSDSRLYFRFVNNGGGYPTSGGFLTYYIYSVGLINPDATDSTAYVLLYANVPLLFSPGLYALDPADSSFTSIGSIDYTISGNSLNLSCAISDLTAQPGWPSWPPSAGFIGAAPVTATAVVTDLTTNDFGKSALMLPSSHMLDFASANTAPTLTMPAISDDGNNTVIAEIIYTDSDNHLPVQRKFVFDGATHNMTACEKTYDTGALFTAAATVSETGWYPYYFEFSDGVATVTTTIDSVFVELADFICGDANSDGGVNVGDAVLLINYIFKEGPAPDPIEAGDINGDGDINVGDAVYLINYIFKEGPAPNC